MKPSAEQAAEPEDHEAPSRDPLRFVVHKHRASQLHYDLRLELDGVLKSWAIPKGPSLEPGDKRLAMMVDDHPLGYADFEGVIPGGEYGAGTVMIWDEGAFVALDEPEREGSEEAFRRGLERGQFTFIVSGEKLKGEFSLVRFKRAGDKTWLLIKKRDRFASAEDVTGLDRSVSQRSEHGGDSGRIGVTGPALAAYKPTKMITSERTRRGFRRRLAAGMVPLVAAVLLLGACGSGANRASRNSNGGVYRDSTFGFRLTYPPGLHARAVFIDYGMVAFKGVVATNLPARQAFSTANASDLSKLPSNAVVFLLEHRDGGPSPALEIPEARFPLRAAAFGSIRGVTLPSGASWREHAFSANGWDLLADVYFGPRASRADRAAIWRTVSSLRFRSLRTGQQTGDGGFLVLGEQSSYQVGSVERVSANTFLVRARRGFYGIGGLAMGNAKPFPCPLRVERAKIEFACKNGPRRWDRMGRPLWKGASDWDYLGVLIAKIGQDGHVLFTPDALRFGTRALERALWGSAPA